MKFSIALMGLLALTAPLCAQPVKRSAEDTRPNDPKVPDAYALSGQFDRIVVMRMKFKTDLLHGMEQLVQQQHIQNGVILAGIGSVRGFHVHQVVNSDFPTKNVFDKELIKGADLECVNGYIVNGHVHAHITVSTGEKVIGGHLEPGTEVFTYAIVTVGVMNGVDLDKGRVEDKTYR